MRYVSMITVAVAMIASNASAQEGHYSQTLDEQMTRVHEGQPAVPGSWDNGAAHNAITTSGAIDSEGGGAIPELPLATQQTDKGVAYLSGGIGDEELAQLKSQEHQYNTHFLFSIPTGAYIGDVTLRISDKSGVEVFAASGVGPYVYTNLPAGSYTVVASVNNGETKQAKITVGKGSVKQNFVFSER